MKHIIRSILSIILLIYLIFASRISATMAGNDLCTDMRIIVNDNSARPFVTAKELARELHNLPSRAVGMKMKDIDTDSIRALLSRIDKIERVEVVRYSTGEIVITVDPMRPVARIFDDNYSYYINREGKRMSADARYYMDVPVIEGHFNDSTFTPTSIIPLLDYIAAHDKWNALVSMIKIKSPGDVLLIPAIKGQVINLGDLDPLRYDSKFRRLDRLYTEVIPHKGWNYYDTISVKWNNQIVASRRDKSHRTSDYVVDEEELNDIDMSSMLAADGVAPGQAVAGRQAKSEKPVPGAARLKETGGTVPSRVNAATPPGKETAVKEPPAKELPKKETPKKETTSSKEKPKGTKADKNKSAQPSGNKKKN